MGKPKNTFRVKLSEDGHKTNAQRCKEYREQVKSREWLDAQSERMRVYRQNLNNDQRKNYNEKAKERMRKMRANKKALAVGSADGPSSLQNKMPLSTRSKTEQQTQLRQYKKEKAREYRANMSATKKRWVRQKDRDRKQCKRAELKNKDQAEALKQNPKGKRQLSKTPSLPSNPEEYAETVAKLVESATPRKKRALFERKLYSTRLRQSLDMTMKGVPKNSVIKVIRKNTATVNKKGLACVLGLRRATLSYRSKGGRQANARKVTIMIRDKIHDFFTRMDVSTAIPNKNKNKDGLYVLQHSLMHTYKEFKCVYPDIKIGLTQFIKEKPKKVKIAKQMKWLQCVCDICANVEYLLKVIKRSLFKYHCDIPEWITGSMAVAAACVCSMDHYNQPCIDGKCPRCGPESLINNSVLPLWASDNVPKILTWKEWMKVEQLVNGKSVKRMKLVLKSGSREAAVRQLKSKLRTHGKHIFIAKWQHKAYKKKVETSSPNTVTAVMDFAENFVCQQQSEAQSAYYSRNLVTLHPIVCTYNLSSGVAIRDSVVIISDDLKHDSSAVHAFVDTLLTHLNMFLPTIQEIHFFSDGCACQYKSCVPFLNIGNKFSQTKVEIEWHFFGSRHGKGPSDGESGVIKSAVNRAIQNEVVHVDTAHEFFKAASQLLSKLDGYSKRHFYFVPSAVINEYRAKVQQPRKFTGVQQIHSIKSKGEGIIHHKKASCFCCGCNGGGNCEFGTDVWEKKNMVKELSASAFVPQNVAFEGNSHHTLHALSLCSLFHWLLCKLGTIKNAEEDWSDWSDWTENA